MSNKITINEMHIIKNMLMLCRISYDIKISGNYIPKIDEVDTFQNLSKDISVIPSQLVEAQTIAILSNDKKTIYIAFAGTHDIHDILDDLEYPQVSPRLKISEEIKFFEGFYREFQGLATSVTNVIEKFIQNGGNNIYLTGHSSGGCTASIFAYYLKNMPINPITCSINVFTFGSPYFTNLYGAKWFENNVNYTRIEIDKDPIPNLPQVNIIGRVPKYFHITQRHIYIKNNTIYFNVMPPTHTTNSCGSFILGFINHKLRIYFHRIETYNIKLNNCII